MCSFSWRYFSFPSLVFCSQFKLPNSIDHSHLRFRARGNAQIHSPWFQMPASLQILLQVLPINKFSIHIHEPWEHNAVEPKGLDTATKLALSTHRHLFSRLRLDDLCPICLDIVPPHVENNLVDVESEGGGGGEVGGSTTLPCGHCFHDTCCGEWFSRSERCPTCRFELTEPSIEAAAARIKCIDASGEYEACDKGIGWLVAETTKAGGLAAKEAALVDEEEGGGRVIWGDEEGGDTEEEEDDDSTTTSMFNFRLPSFRGPSFRRSTPVSPSAPSNRRAMLSAMFRHGRHVPQLTEQVTADTTTSTTSVANTPVTTDPE